MVKIEAISKAEVNQMLKMRVKSDINRGKQNKALERVAKSYLKNGGL